MKEIKVINVHEDISEEEKKKILCKKMVEIIRISENLKLMRNIEK